MNFTPVTMITLMECHYLYYEEKITTAPSKRDALAKLIGRNLVERFEDKDGERAVITTEKGNKLVGQLLEHGAIGADAL